MLGPRIEALEAANLALMQQKSMMSLHPSGSNVQDAIIVRGITGQIAEVERAIAALQPQLDRIIQRNEDLDEIFSCETTRDANALAVKVRPGETRPHPLGFSRGRCARRVSQIQNQIGELDIAQQVVDSDRVGLETIYSRQRKDAKKYVAVEQVSASLGEDSRRENGVTVALRCRRRWIVKQDTSSTNALRSSSRVRPAALLANYLRNVFATLMIVCVGGTGLQSRPRWQLVTRKKPRSSI